VLEPRLTLSGTAYLVDSLADVVADDGAVTLREAIEAANTNVAVTADVLAGSATEMDTVLFDWVALSAEAGVMVGQPITITLGGSQLDIADDLAIQGLGPNVLTVDGDGRSRVFNISVEEADVQLIGLKIIGGRVKGGGGGIYHASGTLGLMNMTVSGNSS